MSEKANSSTTNHIKVTLAEFGNEPINLSNLGRYFDNIEVIRERPEIFDGKRKGWRMNDYWKVKQLLEHNDVAISFDGDMHIISNKVYDIIPLTRKFGVCLPANPRYLVGIDADIGADGGEVEIGTGYAMNCGIIALDNNNPEAVKLAEKYCEIMEKNPARGTLVWWEAMWETGITPCLLPPQWCVCKEDIGIGNEIVLHIGHEEVKSYYNV